MSGAALVNIRPILKVKQNIPFDLPLARLLADYSRRAYRPNSGDMVLESPATDTGVLFADIGDAIVLAFRGTRNLRDWITDAQFFKRPLSGTNSGDAKVHTGFYRGFDSILSNIIGNLLPDGFTAKASVKPLIITGHSLGGALASLAAFFLSRQGFNVRAVYTFASPRVGNAAWRAAYTAECGDRSFRIACAGDLVPLVPGIFTPIRDGYRHVGMEVLLNGSRMMMAPSHYIEMAMDGWKAYRAIKAGDIDFILYFHSIDQDYIASLASIRTIIQ